MATTPQKPTRQHTTHQEGDRGRTLRHSLEMQRPRILRATRNRIRDTRHANTADAGAVLDVGEISEADIQEDLDFALIEMYSETLGRIDDALERLALGDYGNCVDCGAAIAARRLEGLPFAARCRSCEEQQEAQHRRQIESPSWGSVEPFGLAGE